MQAAAAAGSRGQGKDGTFAWIRYHLRVCQFISAAVFVPLFHLLLAHVCDMNMRSQSCMGASVCLWSLTVTL